MLDTITKRDGSTAPFDSSKILNAMSKANKAALDAILSSGASPAATQHAPQSGSTQGVQNAAAEEEMSHTDLLFLTEKVCKKIAAQNLCNVEDIQDVVEECLIRYGYARTAKAYILYRDEHAKIRQAEASLMDIYKKLTWSPAMEEDIKRENANIDGDTAMGTMLKYGSEGAKYFVDSHVLPREMAAAHNDGDIHIHDKDFYMLTQTCCQIDLIPLFKRGFSTGHGHLREPNGIESYAALACIAIQANQNEMHGGQSIPNFDFAMAEGIRKTFAAEYRKHFTACLRIMRDGDAKAVEALAAPLFAALVTPEAASTDAPTAPSDANAPAPTAAQMAAASPIRMATVEAAGLTLMAAAADAAAATGDTELRAQVERAHRFAAAEALKATDRRSYQAMEALIHNLNTMNSRAGAQVPFSSLNYGTDESPEGRMAARNLLLATQAGLGNGETSIFPVQIFKVKEGVNFNPGDPNYDLFQLAMRTSAMRLFPNFSFLDAPFNAQYYRHGDYDTEVAYMGCRTRVLGNIHDTDRQVTCGRGNLSFTSINLPRLALQAEKDVNRFFALLDDRIDLVCRQLMHRLKIQSAKKVRNYPFLMGQGIWLDSEQLDWEDNIEEVLKHGTLTVGFIGLAETLFALVGKHHGQSSEAQTLGLEIISHMRRRMDERAASTRLNFSLIATPAEGLSGRFVQLDRRKFGALPGITDRDYYTNSFHIPVYFSIPAHKKIQLEAPYHALTNAGHITYVELDGDTSKNPEAFESIIRYMHSQGVGYGSVNHPLDRDPVCGYVGVIHDVCPRCGRREGEGVSEEMLRKLKKRF